MVGWKNRGHEPAETRSPTGPASAATAGSAAAMRSAKVRTESRGSDPPVSARMRVIRSLCSDGARRCRPRRGESARAQEADDRVAHRRRCARAASYSDSSGGDEPGLPPLRPGPSRERAIGAARPAVAKKSPGSTSGRRVRRGGEAVHRGARSSARASPSRAISSSLFGTLNGIGAMIVGRRHLARVVDRARPDSAAAGRRNRSTAATARQQQPAPEVEPAPPARCRRSRRDAPLHRLGISRSDPPRTP